MRRSSNNICCRDISKGRENIPIPCVNAIDDDGIPTDYLYVTDNVETTCLNVNRVIGSLQVSLVFAFRIKYLGTII